MSVEKRCDECSFFYGAQGMEGECRRYPAQMPVTEYGSWPPTIPDGWCGEWKPRENVGSQRIHSMSDIPGGESE